MTQFTTRPADTYSPLYFLASLGAGGLVVTFFMYLMFWVPYQGRPVPVFEDVIGALASGGPALQAGIVIALIGIAAMAFLNVKLLIWNIAALRAFQKTENYAALRQSNGETTLLAAPLASAMTINVGFIVGLVFVPGLWNIVEYLFPMALLAFLGLGIWALRLIGGFLGRVLTQGGIFDVTAHNSFAQLLPAFAISMVGVGLAAPSAMSGNTVTVGVSLVLSTFFGVTAIIYTLVAAITGFNSMLHHGTAKEAGPTLMVVVPIVTVLGILFMRQNHGLHVAFDAHGTPGETLIFLSRLLAIEILFLALGLLVLKRQGYWAEFISGQKASAGSYALICPGVAFAVMMHFFVNKGLVGAGVIDKFGLAFWGLTGIAIVAQFMMIWLVLKLNRKHFSRADTPAPVAAE
ncbi:TsoY family (seleno)protein [Roseovarius pacificus]|uniref:TsoY family (seleno)protein n=1 Tax=Roseovarius pacificus TaxID=337701 RepID=UPI00296A6407|nr:hypothetical protein [Roseovarius pacificus]MDW3117646.1 hypothetical protein [Roseovarius pacificus]